MRSKRRSYCDKAARSRHTSVLVAPRSQRWSRPRSCRWRQEQANEKYSGWSKAESSTSLKAFGWSFALVVIKDRCLGRASIKHSERDCKLPNCHNLKFKTKGETT